MQITDLWIRNFKTIRNMHIQDIENALILVGQNNTGKTAVLEALRAVIGDYEIREEDFLEDYPNIEIVVSLKIQEEDLRRFHRNGIVSTYRSCLLYTSCYSLTEIMRYASKFSVSEVTLHEEIQNLKSYFSIMKSRYRQRFEYEMEIDEEALDFMIPKLTLQPLVENGIKYSLLEKEVVFVKVFLVRFNGDIIIEIKDNGIGISEEDAEKVRDRIKRFENDNSSKEITENIQIGGMGLSLSLIHI